MNAWPTISKSTFLYGNFEWISSVAFSPNSKLLAACGQGDPAIQLWDVLAGVEATRFFECNIPTFSVAFDPNNDILAAGDNDQQVRLWDIRTGRVLRTLVGHAGAVVSVCYSPSGQMLASGSVDATIKIWDGQLGTL